MTGRLEPLLAAKNRVQRVSWRYREEVAGDIGAVWFLVIPIVAVAAAWFIHRWYQRRSEPLDTPEGLLERIARAHRLPRRVRRSLRHLAGAAKLNYPASMVLSRAEFDDAVRRAGAAADRWSEDLVHARRRLFGD